MNDAEAAQASAEREAFGESSPPAQCQWPKGCHMGRLAFVTEASMGSLELCGGHFLEWLTNMQWRDDITAASFTFSDKHADQDVRGAVLVGEDGERFYELAGELLNQCEGTEDEDDEDDVTDELMDED